MPVRWKFDLSTNDIIALNFDWFADLWLVERVVKGKISIGIGHNGTQQETWINSLGFRQFKIPMHSFEHSDII